MKDKFGNILWGAAFILIGLIAALKSFNVVDFNVFFEGWWTLFIIVPAVVSMVQNGIKTSNVIVLLIGVFFLLSARDILGYDTFAKLIVPTIFLLIGVNIIFKDQFNKNYKTIKTLNKNGLNEYNAIFSGQEVNFPAEKFEGANINATFGGVDLNLKNAIIDSDIVIEASAIFGGIKILVPQNVRVKVSSTPVFGGVSNKVNPVAGENMPTIYVNSTCMFGGVEII
ncbi:MAG: cell wall-active antibiotics response protein [Clostridia bacterium]|nr:cell wall-active antibiotics response protein [Clostridia bacterium]